MTNPQTTPKLLETGFVPITPLQRWLTCSRKRSYETQSKANKAAKRLGLNVYKCPSCTGWHITKKEA